MKSKTFLGCSHKTRFSQFSESMPTNRSYFALGNLEWILHSWNKVVKLWEVIYLLNVWYFQPSLLFFRSTIWNLWFVNTCFPFEIQFTFFCRHDWKETFFTSSSFISCEERRPILQQLQDIKYWCLLKKYISPVCSECLSVSENSTCNTDDKVR